MTELYISGKQVVLPDDLNITQCFENPYFTRSSNYSLDVELPLSGCSENMDIFGHLNRLDITKQKMLLPAKLIVGARIVLVGSAILLKISDKSVKIQLVSGNAEFNFLTNNDIYIDDLDLGEVPYPPYALTGDYLPYEDKPKYYGSVDRCEAVWLPVLYNSEKLYNDVVYDFGTNKFHPRPYWNSCCVQPYLLTVIKRIVEHFGYRVDQNYINDTFLRDLYIASAVQTNKIAGALPHWTISEFFEELEKFCGVITVIDEREKTVNFLDINTYYDIPVYEYIDEVLAEFETAIQEKGDEKDITTGNIGYDLPSQTDDGYWRLDYDLLEAVQKKDFSTYAEAKAYWESLKSDDKKYWLMTTGNRFYINYRENDKDSLREVNVYADLLRNDETTDIDVSLKMVPAKIIPYNIGVYNTVPDYLFGHKMATLILNVPSVCYQSDIQKSQKIAIQEAIEGKQQIEAKRKRKDVMELVFNTGNMYSVNVTYKDQTFPFEYPIPFTDFQQTVPAQLSAFAKSSSLSLNDVCVDSVGHRLRTIKKIHSTVTYTIKFIKRWIPNTRRVFYIQNKKYVCKKIEANITGAGLVVIQQGVFYRIE